MYHGVSGVIALTLGFTQVNQGKGPVIHNLALRGEERDRERERERQRDRETERQRRAYTFTVEPHYCSHLWAKHFWLYIEVAALQRSKCIESLHLGLD